MLDPPLPVVDVELLARLAQAGQGDEPLRLLACLVDDADAAGQVRDFSLSGYARKLGYGPSGRRTLGGYLRPLIAAGAVAYVPARGPAPGYCQLHLLPPAGTRALTRAPGLRRACFCAPDQHFSRPLKGLKEGKGTPPLTPPRQLDPGAATRPGGGDDKTGRPSGPALIDALVAALPIEARTQPRQAKDGGGWHALEAVAAQLADLVGVDAMVAAVTADPPPQLRSPVGWLLARTRRHLAQAQATPKAAGASDPTDDLQTARSHAGPGPTGEETRPLGQDTAPPRTSGPTRVGTTVGQTPPDPPDGGEGPEVNRQHQRRTTGMDDVGRRPSLSPVPKSAPLSDALVAVARLTIAGRWRDELLAASRGDLIATNSTVRTLSQALAETLAATPGLTGRALVSKLTDRPMPTAVKDLPSLLAARARHLGTAPTRAAPSSPAPPPVPPGAARCGACDGNRITVDAAGTAHPCPLCRPNTTFSSPPPPSNPVDITAGITRVGDLLPQRHMLRTRHLQEA